MSLANELKELAELATKVKALQAENAKLAEEILAEIKGRKPIELFGEGCLKDYADAVKKSGGLTVVKPSVVKALEAVAKEPKAAVVKAAEAQIKAHVDAVDKEHKAQAKTDKDLAKRMASFETALLGVVKRLGLQATV